MSQRGVWTRLWRRVYFQLWKVSPTLLTPAAS